MVTSLSIIKALYQQCEGCILENQHTDSFLVGNVRRVEQPLKLVQLMKYKRDILNFIDDFILKKCIFSWIKIRGFWKIRII